MTGVLVQDGTEMSACRVGVVEGDVGQSEEIGVVHLARTTRSFVEGVGRAAAVKAPPQTGHSTG